jgi:hypothetical protein
MTLPAPPAEDDPWYFGSQNVIFTIMATSGPFGKFRRAFASSSKTDKKVIDKYARLFVKYTDLCVNLNMVHVAGSRVILRAFGVSHRQLWLDANNSQPQAIWTGWDTRQKLLDPENNSPLWLPL